MSGRFQLETPPQDEPGLLMTSMIDVIFILLAFFVCVSEVRKGKLVVDVPEVAAAEQGPAQAPEVDPVVVEVTRGDEIFVEGQRAADEAQIEQLLRAGATRRGVAADKIPLYLSGDKEASNGAMMRVLGQAHKVGFGKIELPVEKAKTR